MKKVDDFVLEQEEVTHSSAQMEVAALDRSVDSTSVQTGSREMLEG